MSVISSITVTPNRIEIIARYLESCGEQGIARADLEAQLSPEPLRRASVSEDGDDVANVSTTVTEPLSETIRLGLAEIFLDDGRECVRFVPPSNPKPASLLERLERILLDRDTSEVAKQGEFRRALAWLLAQDPRHPMNIKDNVTPLIQEQCGGKGANVFELTSSDRSRNFYYWARFLGYAWYIGQKTSTQNETQTVIIPDPTAALERHLPRLMSPGERWPLAHLVNAWGNLAPVLEGGSARIEVEELMDPKYLPPQRGMLSRSTSFALERLDRRGFIHLEQQADAPAHLGRLLNSWPDPRYFSHVTYTRTA